MRRTLAAAAVLLPSVVLACGGFYAQGVEVSADQKIFVVHRDGVETYVFRPHFCGEATDFGVILPIPSALTVSPSLAPNALFDELDRITAPTVVEECPSEGLGCGGARGDLGGSGDFDSGVSSGVGVIDRGQVGVFDYVLLQATSASAFTDWLDQNGFPRGGATDDAYASYVEKHWYFVAFKVAAGGEAPDAGQRLCGDLGPIQLSFASTAPVVPARIAGVNGGGGTWRLFTITPQQQALSSTSAGFTSRRYFAATVDQATLSVSPAVSNMARAGERLTALDVTFSPGVPAADIALVDTARSDFHGMRVVYKENCVLGCSTGPGIGAWALIALLLWLAFARRRRARLG